MSAFLLAVMFLLDPTERIDAEAAAAVSEDANQVELPGKGATDEGVKRARIRSKTSDIDRQSGVVLFEGDVFVEYANDYSMHADQIYVFFVGTNELSRIVAIGNVALTNDTRVGECALATYRRKKGEIEMFGDDSGKLARLNESEDGSSELEGTRIRFWIDSEQVEVENSRISVEDSEEVIPS